MSTRSRFTTLLVLVSLVLASVPAATAAPMLQKYDCSGYGEGVEGTDSEGQLYVCRLVDGQYNWIKKTGDAFDCSGYGQGVEAEAGGERYRCTLEKKVTPWTLRWVEVEKPDQFDCKDYARQYGTGVTAEADGVLYRCDGSKWQEWFPPNATFDWRWDKTSDGWALDMVFRSFCTDAGIKIFGVKGGTITTEDFAQSNAVHMEIEYGMCPYHADSGFAYYTAMYTWFDSWQLVGLETVEIWWGNPTSNHKTTRIPLP